MLKQLTTLVLLVVAVISSSNDDNDDDIVVNNLDDQAYLAYDYFTPGPRDDEGIQRSKYKPIKKTDVDMIYHETSEYIYYGERGHEPLRVTNITSAEFRWYMQRGLPLIVSDAARDWPMRGWTCDSIKNEFSKERFRQEYTGTFDAQRNKDKIGKTDFDTSKEIDNGPKDVGPNYAPYYWDVKDRRGKRIRREIKAKTRLPYFMRDNMHMAGPTMNESAEFWFSRTEAGAKAHIDQHCEATVSVQLSGQKRWRLSIQPNVDNVLTIRRFFDGDTSVKAWQPLYDFVLHEGEGLFFPPGMIHETRNVGDKCAVSVTYQYFEPIPVIFMREWLPRLILGSALNECSERWNGLVTFTPRVRPPKNVQHARTRAEKVFSKFDTNNNNEIELREIVKLYKRWDNDQLSQMISIEIDAPNIRKYKGKIIKSLASTALNYHDLNEDGRVSKDEFVTNIQQWSGILMFRQYGEQLIKKYRKEKRKIKWCKRKDKLKAELLTIQSYYGNKTAKTQIKTSLSPSCQELSSILLNKYLKNAAINTNVLRRINNNNNEQKVGINAHDEL